MIGRVRYRRSKEKITSNLLYFMFVGTEFAFVNCAFPNSVIASFSTKEEGVCVGCTHAHALNLPVPGRCQAWEGGCVVFMCYVDPNNLMRRALLALSLSFFIFIF